MADKNEDLEKREEEMEFDDEGSDSEEDEESDEEKEGEGKAFLPGDQLEEGEELVCDESAYIMYHQAQSGDPCLSFDVIPDALGDNRTDFPQTMFLACGTQGEGGHDKIIVMKMSNLQRNKKKDDEDDDDDIADEDSDSEDQTEKPVLEASMIRHQGSVNRLRQTVVNGKHLAATWSAVGKVFITDLTAPLEGLHNSVECRVPGQIKNTTLFTFSGHQTEGFAVDWSPTTPGKLLTGDCVKNIHLWSPQEGASWHVDQRPFAGHTASVEDLQWSPNEANVFASCSVDKSIRIWDARAAPSKACMLTADEAHARDVNVIHWNRKEPFIISGGDDGVIKIWDLRQFQSGKAVALFKHHTAPITSVEWHPTDGTVFAAAGSDSQITLWDLAVERDSESNEAEEPSVPPQLLFIHQGQKDIKELHWHPQIPGAIISTAHSDFNIFRTISV